ncbi:MAG: four helix bundle protein [Desulfuromusa sp.]|jgi:four helix bundle protein|nr:four helix bundle protein [Desulfuromusa sp.]
MKDNVIRQKSYDFALKIIELYRKLLKEKEFILSKQLLRSSE